MSNQTIAEMLETGRIEPVELYGNDALGNEVFKGETILVCNGEFFFKTLLSNDQMELLEALGAVEKIAK